MKKNAFKLLTLVLGGALLLTGCDSRYVVLNPSGPVAKTELDLIVLSAILSAIVIIPVLGILWFIVHRYRAKPGNNAPYKPDWDDNKWMEVIWWGIPIVIIGILGYETAKTTYTLAKPPVSDAKPITIQVTSLDSKWLFQYPDQNVATVNYVEIPAGVPVQFVLTADAPMNSFWVPELGGQEYTMPGMQMNLWLQADKPGTYFGTGANFTGEGFAHMQFQVVAKPQSEFTQWVSQIKQTAPALTRDGYNELTKPSTMKQASYSSFPEGIFKETVDKNGGQYMHHATDTETTHDMSGMNMPIESTDPKK
ncbi:MAG: ubiquinol oxidase subunit II [Tumebacillaceae bacterium]